MSSKQNNDKQVLKVVLEGTKVAAETLDKHPSQVTITELKEFVNVNDWALRLLGGYNAVKKRYFPLTDKDLSKISEMKNFQSYVNKLEKQVGERENFENKILDAIKEEIRSLELNKIKVDKVQKSKTKANMTLELMVSDVHYGKKTKLFDLEVCRKRMKELSRVFNKELVDNQKLFNVEKIIVALIGDLMENFEMHGSESAISCEFRNPKQIGYSIISLFKDIIVPIAKTGIPVEIPCVTGNHDRGTPQYTLTNPGENNFTWAIYKALELLCETAGLSNVTFHIPDISYKVLTVYGNNILYEHGDNLKGANAAAIEKLIQDRSKQTGLLIDMARFGHWHEYLCIGRGRAIVNESVCGQDGYSTTKGYNSHAGQTINYYIETKDRPNCFYKSFPVYLG